MVVSLMYNYKTFEEYFYEIKNIWSQLNTKNRIIPFCTPMKFRPKFFIIGLNHSVFSNDDKEANLIANDFSNSIPKLNTYTNHNHKFAKGGGVNYLSKILLLLKNIIMSLFNPQFSTFNSLAFRINQGFIHSFNHFLSAN